MKKTEVNVCDVCRNVITQKKCEICDKDICENCEDDMAVGLANGGILFYIIACGGCSKKLEVAKLKQYFEEEPHRKIRKNLLNIFKNAIVVEILQDKEEKEADKNWMMDKLKRDSIEFKLSHDRLKKVNSFKSSKLLKGGMFKI